MYAKMLCRKVTTPLESNRPGVYVCVGVWEIKNVFHHILIKREFLWYVFLENIMYKKTKVVFIRLSIWVMGVTTTACIPDLKLM